MRREESWGKRKRGRTGILKLWKHVSHAPPVMLAFSMPLEASGPGLYQPRGLCRCRSLCLECSYPGEPASGLIPSLLIEKPSRATQQPLRHAYDSPSQNFASPDTTLSVCHHWNVSSIMAGTFVCFVPCYLSFVF